MHPGVHPRKICPEITITARSGSVPRNYYPLTIILRR